MNTQVRRFEALLEKKVKETEEVVSFYFRPLLPEKFTFIPGQFVNLTLDSIPETFGKSRAYSIASSPRDELIRLGIRIKPEGFTHELAGLKEGSKVILLGPLGHFVFDKEKHKKVVFLAGGIGITPFLSMIRYITQENIDAEAYLFFSNKTKDSIPYYEELVSLSSHKNIHIVFTLTREQREGFESGRISEQLITRYIKTPQDYTYFACGPLEMINTSETIVANLGVSKDKFKKEQWGKA